MIDTNFIASLRGLHPYEVVVEIGDYYRDKLGGLTAIRDRYLLTREVLATLTDCAKRRQLDWRKPDLSGTKEEYVSKASAFIQSVVNAYRHQLDDVTARGRKYSDILFGEDGLSDDEISEIQGLLLKLRQLVATNDDLSEHVKAEVIENVEEIEKLLLNVGVDARTVVGFVMTLWALTKEAKELYEIVIIIAQIATQGLEKQIGIPLNTIAQKLLK